MKRLSAAKWAASQAQIPVQWKALMVIFRVIIMSLVLFIMFRVMLKEKQLLKIKSILTRQQHVLQQTKMSWHSFQRAYETRFRRAPPEGYQKWLDFAQEQDCEPFLLYTAIERDLAPFRRAMKSPQPNAPPTLLQWSQLEDTATNYTAGAYMLVEIKDNQLTVIREDLTDWFAQHPILHNAFEWKRFLETQKLHWNLKWLFDPVINHKPPITTRFVVNLHHRPRLPVDAKVPIFSSHHEVYHTDHDDTHPGEMSLEIANKNRNGIIDPRDSTTRDLLLPHLYVAGGRMGAAGMTSSPAIGGFWFWPFFRQGKPWTQRKKAIAWRGSTLGNYQKNSTSPAQSFFGGPRFGLMKQWGGTQVHQVEPDVPVNVDFAFTKLLVQGEDTMDKTQREAIKAAAKKEFRFASRLSYRQMQKYQYLVDVDSNAFSVRFSSMLRTGSLVFKTTRYREWFSERLRSWKDYIPLNYDTSDLAKKLKWANERSPESIMNIIQHGRDTVERHIRPEDMQCYTYRMMLEYSTLFDKNSILPREPEAAAGATATPGRKSLRKGRYNL